MENNFKINVKEFYESVKDKDCNLTEDFLGHLASLVDAKDFKRAVWLFVNGYLPIEAATGDKPINVSDIRKTVIAERKRQRDLKKENDAKLAKLAAYLNTVKTLELKLKHGESVLVFIDDGKITAFAAKKAKNIKILGANCTGVEHNWQPHEHLQEIRKIKKSFYRDVKRAAYNEPKELFDFNKMGRYE